MTVRRKYGMPVNVSIKFVERHLQVRCPVCCASINAKCRNKVGVVMEQKTHQARAQREKLVEAWRKVKQ